MRPDGRDGDAPADSVPGVPLLLGECLPVLEDRLAGSDGLTLCTDFDGTLAPVVEDPAAASIPDRTRRALAELAERPAVDVAVISGRHLADLRERVDVAGCTFAGNHGLELERDGERWVHPEVERRRADLERILETLSRRVEALSGCRLEDKGLSATVHHRGAPVDHDRVRALVAAVLADEQGFEPRDGRKVVEVRPIVEWDKGAAVRHLADERRATVYLGDDVTDEDAFRALRALPTPGVGVLVGERPSAATFRVPDADGVRAFLEWLTRTGTLPNVNRTGRDSVTSAL